MGWLFVGDKTVVLAKLQQQATDALHTSHPGEMGLIIGGGKFYYNLQIHIAEKIKYMYSVQKFR